PVKNVLITVFPPRGPGGGGIPASDAGGASSSAAAYSGGDGQASGGPEHAEGEQRQQGDQGGAADDLGVVALVEPVADVPAEAAETDVGGDGGRRHDLDGGRPQPAEDQRERHRQFDLEEDPRLPHAHAPGGVHRGGVDGAHRLVGGHQDRRHGEDDQRDHHGQQAEADEQHDQHQQPETGQGAGGVGDEGDRVAAAPGVPGEQPDGQADRGGDGEREQRVLEVFEQAPGDAVVALPVGGVAEEGVDEGEDVHRMAPSGAGRRAAAFGRPRVPAPERGIH